MATKRQIEYIDILSSYPSTKVDDKKDIEDFLRSISKMSAEECSTKEAHELINLLLKRNAEYTFVCGKKAHVDKQEYNRFNLFGKTEACIHACPDPSIGGDVNNCKHFEKYASINIQEP